jgi:hypothetical protein
MRTSAAKKVTESFQLSQAMAKYTTANEKYLIKMSSLLLAAVWVSQLGIPSCHIILPLYGSQDDANNFFGA